MNYKGTMALKCAITGLLFVIAIASQCHAQSIGSVTIDPVEATSNSVYKVQFVWTCSEAPYFPDAGTLRLEYLSDPYGGSAVTCPVPEECGVGHPITGRLYTIWVSAGLNLENESPHPKMKHLYLFKALKANSDGSPRSVTFQIKATFTQPPENEGDEPTVTEVTADVGPVTVHDSHPCGTNPRYGGVKWDRDWLTGYVLYPDSLTLDPLFTTGYEGQSPDDPENPDDGTTSSTYTFRVKYNNDDGRAPEPWHKNYGNGTVFLTTRPGIDPSGVVLYVYDPYANSGSGAYTNLPMQPNAELGDGVYEYIIRPDQWNSYRALRIGNYRYFFGCSDDYIRDMSGEIPTWAEEQPFSYGPLSGNCLFHSKPSPEFGNVYNMGIYVCRPTFVPGVTTVYPWSANEHPKVTVGLWSPEECGYHTHMYTIDPLYQMHNPNGQATTGATTNDRLSFQIVYGQIDGIPPQEISVWIYKGNDTNGPLERRITLEPTEAVTSAKIKAGLLYRTPSPISLEAGPHVCYFTATDGKKRVKWPVRGGNDWIWGPYINHRPELLDAKVEPKIGTAGDNFRWTVTYRDADNQRPYQAHLIIQLRDGGTLENGGAVRVVMEKLDKSDNKYDDGVVYKFDSANLEHVLQPGQRKFYFEFVDDWGIVTDPNERIYGEKVWYPPRSGDVPNWIDGPFIKPNTKPILSLGKVESTDGTANSATLWRYSVRYTDADNQPPTYVIVYIGTVHADGTITWDGGHAMLPTDPSDVVYTDGKDYSFLTRLGGDPTAVSYYYCMVAADGIDPAVYDPSTGSTSAHTIWNPMETLTSPTPTDTFFTAHKPLVAGVPTGGGVRDQYYDSENWPLYEYPLVYDASNKPLSYDIENSDFENGVIKLYTSATTIKMQYWFGVPGPTSVGLNTPPRLTAGQVSPNPGTSQTTFRFSVVYSDQDGPQGQMPSFVRVKVDDVPYDLSPVFVGTPNYKIGVTYQTTMKLSPGVHRYYFEASDGAGYAVYDASGSRSSDSPILGLTQIIGPYVNDPPTLTLGTVYPNPVTGISPAQWVNYSVTYTDLNNEPPDAGYPVVYVNKATTSLEAREIEHNAKVAALGANTITAVTIDGQSPGWTVDEFKGLPLQITSGQLSGTAFTILSNTEDTLTLIQDLTGSGLQVDDTFSIGKLQLQKQDPADNNYTDGVVYEYRIPGLGAGSYVARFKSITTEVIGQNNKTRQTVVRFPITESDISGPIVIQSAPPGNVAPVLSDGSILPQIGKATDEFTATVTYRDDNGDPPTRRPEAQGYVRVVIDNVHSIDLLPTGLSDWVTGVVMTAPVTVTTGGIHRYYFEASDGWLVTRLPATGYYTYVVNRKPVLLEPKVTPIEHNAGREYTYSVIYKDPDGQPPFTLGLYIDGERIEIKGYPDPASGTDYVNGVRYVYSIRNMLAVGVEHKYYFTASDGIEDATPTPEKIGPRVHANLPPQLVGGKVEPATGFDDSTYTYTVKYLDPLGEDPEYVKVYIDGTDEAHAHLMTKVPGQNDYTLGVTYTYLQSGLSAGTNHTFFFKASDWLDEAVNPEPPTDHYTGPVVKERPTASITIQCGDSPAVGEATTISGKITPAMSVKLTITLTEPDGDLVTMYVNTGSDGRYSKSWTPSATGTWKLKATWAGSGDYKETSSPEISVTVLGPSYTVTGLDLISIPMRPNNSFVNTTFGSDPPYAVAAYDPTIGNYKIYSLLPRYRTDFDFPGIFQGRGYWIKTDVPKVIAPKGSLNTSTVTVELKPGWNQIGCPYINEVNWADLRVSYNGSEPVDLVTAASRGWVRDYGWGYDAATRQYRLVHATRSGAERTLKPWHGYWIRAFKNCQLRFSGNDFPPPPSDGMSVETQAIKEAISAGASAPIWEVNLVAKLDDLVDEQNYFGMAKSTLRVESPAYFEGFVDVYFTDDNGGMYAIDLKSGEITGKSWRFVVATDQGGGDIELTWPGIENVPDNISLTLVDELSGKSVDMKSDSSFILPARAALGGRPFRIIVGK